MTKPEPRLTAVLFGEPACSFVRASSQSAIDVRRKDGSLALPVDQLQAIALLRCKLAAAHIVRDNLRYLILLTAKTVAVRTLRMDAPRHGEISKPKPLDLQWPARFDRAHCGQIGGVVRQLWLRPGAAIHR